MQVVSLIQKSSEVNGEAVQLGVVRALLTVTTAEHFVLHGDALISVSCFQTLAWYSTCRRRISHGHPCCKGDASVHTILGSIVPSNKTGVGEVLQQPAAIALCQG